MKQYIDPEMKIVKFTVSDIVMVSGGTKSRNSTESEPEVGGGSYSRGYRSMPRF